MLIGISGGDFVIAINLAREICSNCLKAPKEFHEAGRAADGLSVVLEALEDERKDPRSPLRRNKRRARDLRGITESCESVLAELNTIVLKYSSLGTDDVKLRHRFRFPHKEVGLLKKKLAYHTSMLSTFLDTVGLGSLRRLEKTAEGAEVRGIQVQETVVSTGQSQVRVEQKLDEAATLGTKMDRKLDDASSERKEILKAVHDLGTEFRSGARVWMIHTDLKSRSPASRTRHNDLALHNEMSHTRDKLEEIRTQSASHSKECLQMASTQATVAESHHSKVVKSLSEYSKNTDGLFSNIKERMEGLGKGQATLLTQTDEWASNIDGQLSNIEKHMAALLKGLQNTTNNSSCTTFTTFNGPARATAASLGTFEPHISRIFSSSRSWNNASISADDVQWLQAQFQGMLADAWSAGSLELQTEPEQQTFHESNRCKFTRCSLRNSPSAALDASVPGPESSQNSPTCPLPGIIAMIEFRCFNGKLFVLLRKESTKTGTVSLRSTVTGGRLVLLPSVHSFLSGVLVQFDSCLNGEAKFHHTLSTFGIHPKNSEIFSLIRLGDRDGVSRLLAAGKVFPNDRDVNGNSLLWVRLIEA